MVTNIRRNEKPAQTASADCSEIWERMRACWKTHDGALAIAKDISATAYRNIISNTLSVNENNVFSPATLYYSLLLLAELCAKQSKAEIYRAIASNEQGADKIAEAVRNSVIGDVGVFACSLDNSIWLNDNAVLNTELIKSICDRYGAEAFAGPMGTEEMDSEIQKWIDGNTGELLSKQASGIQTTQDTLFEMLITSYFRSDWDKKFWPEKTKPGVFHINNKATVECEFMHCREHTQGICGYQYTAVSKELQMDYRMWFIVPNEGVELKNLIGSKPINKLLTAPEEMPLVEYDVSFAIPKFDISSNVDMKIALQGMGIHSVFDEGAADFSPISSTKPLVLSKANHATRITVAEDGVEAASFVDYSVAVAGILPDVKHLHFTLNRPFLFAITKGGKIPLYVGAIVNPTEH